MDIINQRINNEYSDKINNELTYSKLLNEYLDYSSVKNKILEFKLVLEKNLIPNENIIKIIEDYLPNLIPPGLKGVVRGNKFNKIIKDLILNLKLDNNKFDIQFEKKLELYITDEIPDWYIVDKTTNKYIIGMNQVDLWGGGAQTIRGSKYIINNSNSQIICVISNYISFKNTNSKIFKIFQKGFNDNTLCYIGNLENLIKIKLGINFIHVAKT
jgi:hypothetical protein